LLLYRGFSRWLTDDQSQGFGNAFEGLRQLAIGRVLGIPVPFGIMLVIALAAAAVLNLTIYGRYLQALGRNEIAARYSGINTDLMKILAYAGCSLLAGLGGVLFALDVNSIQPSGLGEFYELYAIAAAVLGGCSLRGGEGSILGVLIGTAILRVLYNAINILGIPTHLEFAIIGAVILIGVVVDEIVKRVAARRRAARAALG
jgi:ribose transport system permease protein